jgi:hypothetical protein
MTDNGMRKWGGDGLMDNEIEREFEYEYNCRKKRMERLQVALYKDRVASPIRRLN